MVEHGFIQQQIAEKVSNHLIKKKKILETIIQSQIATDESKCLSIGRDRHITKIYTKNIKFIETKA